MLYVVKSIVWLMFELPQSDDFCFINSKKSNEQEPNMSLKAASINYFIKQNSAIFVQKNVFVTRKL